MRTQTLLALSAISTAVAALACSSGGTGNPTFFDPALSGGGGSVPALGPLPKPTGGSDDDGQNPEVDSGGGVTDTGVRDTGAPKDTGGGAGDICVSTCSADPKAAETACRSAIAGATCAAEYKAWYTCRATNRTCDETNKTDETALASACASQASAVTTCAGG
jgi:hypothetical protein